MDQPQGVRSLGYREGEFGEWGPLKRIWRGRSQNVYTVIAPESGLVAERTVCLVSHMDSSRSGWMFQSRMRPHLGGLIGVVGLGVAMRTVDALAELIPPKSSFKRGLRRTGRRLGVVGQLLAGIALILIGQREFRGEDVPGANDNASGVGVCLALARELARRPLVNTRVVVLVTGCEEAGLLGMRHFLSQVNTEGWMFLNFDGMGAPAPLRYLEVEGGPLTARAADPGLIALAKAVGEAGGELSISAHRHGSGLAYDSTAVLSRGGRALTWAAQGENLSQLSVAQRPDRNH